MEIMEIIVERTAVRLAVESTALVTGRLEPATRDVSQDTTGHFVNYVSRDCYDRK